MFNGIVRRGHKPREPAIVRMMESVGLTVQEARDAESTDEGSDDMEVTSESAESEMGTEDEEVAASVKAALTPALFAKI